MKELPFSEEKATEVLTSISKRLFSPRAACGDCGISYADLLRWLEEDVSDFAYKFELALAKRVHTLEKTWLETGDPHVLKILGPLMRVSNPEAFDESRGKASPARQQPRTAKPFDRTWVEPTLGEEAGVPKRVVKLKTAE